MTAEFTWHPQARKALIAQIDYRNMDPSATLTGLFVRESDIIRFK